MIHNGPRSRAQMIEVGFWAPEAPSSAGRVSVFAEMLAHVANRIVQPYPDVQTCVDLLWSEQERNAVVRYLEQGKRVMAYLGFSTCRFCKMDNGCAEFSDGVYVWPEGFKHYLLQHGVRPPQKFVRWALRTR